MAKFNMPPVFPVVVPSKPRMSNKDQILYDTACGDSHSAGWTNFKPVKEKENRK